MKKLNEIIEKIQKIKPKLQNEFAITEIGIFGSYVRGEETDHSDVDIVIDYDKNKRFSIIKFLKLENLLSDILGKKVFGF